LRIARGAVNKDMGLAMHRAARWLARLFVVRHRTWLALALALASIGCAASLLSAIAASRAAAADSREALRASAVQLASTLRLAIQHEDDLVVSASGFLANDPTASSAQFRAWAQAVDAFGRYPELLGIAHSAPVAPSELPALLARLEKAAAGTLPALRGPAPSYCLSQSVAYRRGMGSMFAAGRNVCRLSPEAWAAGLDALDTGQPAYAPWVPADRSLGPLLVVFAPLYDGTQSLAAAGRRRGFTRWVAIVVRPRVLLARALRGYAGTAVRFSYRRAGASVAISAGSAPSGAGTDSVALGNGWTVRTRAAIRGVDLLSNEGGALAIIGVGGALSLLVAALVFVLGTGRSRALRLVELRTTELRRLALHDPLTGLPNRALLTDRIRQMLARSVREGRAGAVAYLDIDDFKNINDTFGHAAGDRLLTAVAGRVSAGVRSADTVCRIGGDEFVVLVEAAQGDESPDVVARRLLELIGAPFDIGVGFPVHVTASVGVALAKHMNASELLRCADVALYEAKSAGKNGYAIFDPQNVAPPEIELVDPERTGRAGSSAGQAASPSSSNIASSR